MIDPREQVKEAIERIFAPAINFKAPYAREMTKMLVLRVDAIYTEKASTPQKEPEQLSLML